MKCEVINGNNRFRYRVGAIILEDNCVLLLTDKHNNGFYPPCGDVEITEVAETAVKRNLKEMFGVDCQTEKLVYVHENFCSNAHVEGDERGHEIVLYFLIKPIGEKKPQNEALLKNGKTAKICWIPIDDINKYDVFPIAIKSDIKNLTKDDFKVKHIVTVFH